MICSLEGVAAAISGDAVVLKVGGVGYRVFAGPNTLALCGYNYWTADRGHPCAVLGMIYALEVIASVYGGTFTSAIKEALLLDSDRGTSFIGSHATLDMEHMASLRVVLNTLQDEASRHAVVESTIVNFSLLTRIFEHV